VREASLGTVLAAIRRESTIARGATHGSMLRNEIYCFARAGTFIERADNTARILDVKYYLLLPSLAYVGTPLDTAQWDNVLRSLSGERAYRWLNAGRMDARSIADFVILDARFPRSLAFCYATIDENLAALARLHGGEGPAHELMRRADQQLTGKTIDEIFDLGLHQFLGQFIVSNQAGSDAIAEQYRSTVQAAPHASRDPPHDPLPFQRTGRARSPAAAAHAQGDPGAGDPRLDDGVFGRARGARLRRPEPQPRDAGVGRGRGAGSRHHLPRHGPDRGQGRRHRPACRPPAAVGFPRPDRADPARSAHPPARRHGLAR